MNKEQIAFLKAVERAEAADGDCYVPNGSGEESAATDLHFALHSDIHRYDVGPGEWDVGYRLSSLGRMLLALSDRIESLETTTREGGGA